MSGSRMSWATGDIPSRITGGGGSRMPWATHSKCNGETPLQTTGGEWKLMVVGYSLYGILLYRSGSSTSHWLLTLISGLKILLGVEAGRLWGHSLTWVYLMETPSGTAGEREAADPGTLWKLCHGLVSWKQFNQNNFKDWTGRLKDWSIKLRCT